MCHRRRQWLCSVSCQQHRATYMLHYTTGRHRPATYHNQLRYIYTGSTTGNGHDRMLQDTLFAYGGEWFSLTEGHPSSLRSTCPQWRAVRTKCGQVKSSQSLYSCLSIPQQLRPTTLRRAIVHPEWIDRASLLLTCAMHASRR